MNIKLLKAEFTDKPVLRNLMELYQYDFSEFDSKDVDEHGFYGYKYLDNYWTDETRHPFLIKVDGKIAGFALVGSHHLILLDFGMAISEFFIMRKYRRKGIGRYIANRIFNLFPGKWEVTVMEANKDSYIFWKKVIDRYTDGNFKEIYLNNERWRGTVFCFDNSASEGKHPERT